MKISNFSVFDKMSDGLLILDANWRYVYVNKKAGALLQRDPDEIIGKVVWDEFPEAKSAFFETYEKVLTTRTFHETEQYFKPFNAWYENRVYPIEQGIAVFFTDITHVKESESERIDLLKHLNRLQKFVDASNDAFQVANEDGTLIYINSVASERLGIDKTEVSKFEVLDFENSFETKKDWFDHVEDLKNNSQLLFNGVNTNQKTGHRFPVEVRIKYEVVEDVGYVIAISRDITDRRKMEKKLQESIDFNENIIESLTDGFSLLDLNGKHLKVNKALCNMVQFSKAELIGQGPPHPYWPEDQIEKINEAFELVLNGSASNFQLTFQRKNGEQFPVIVSPTFIHDSEGKIVNYMATVKDVSEIFEAQTVIQKSEQRLRAILDSTELGIWDYDIHTNKTQRSLRHDQCFGSEKPISEWNYEVFIGFIHPEDRKKVEEAFFTMIERGGAYDVEYRVVWPDGSLHWLNSAGRSIYDAHGNIERVIGIVQEISDRKEDELKIKNSIREKETLLAEIHHRVKNNLAVVTGLMQLQAYDTDNTELIDRLNVNISRIKSIANIHEELYKSHDFSQVSLKKNIQDLVEGIKNVGNHHIDFQLNLTPISLNINDALPFALIVNEVITNSIKHAFINESNPKISIQLSEDDQHISLKIHDNGIGLPVDYHERHSLSMGFNLIKSLADQLEADCSFTNQHGVLFKMNLLNRVS